MDPYLPGRVTDNAKTEWERAFAEEMSKIGKRN